MAMDPTKDRTKAIDQLVRDAMCWRDGTGIGPTDRFVEDIGMDSLDRVEFVMSLEEEFGVDINDDTAEGWRTIGDVYRWAEDL